MPRAQIITCGCGDTDKFAKDAFKLLFPKEDVPPITQTPNFSEFGEWEIYPKAMAKAKQKYAFYITDDELWDLIKGVRVA